MKRNHCSLGSASSKMTLRRHPPYRNWNNWKTSIAGQPPCMRAWNGWGHSISSRGLSGQEVQSFREAVASLVSMYKRHISIEDDLVFPIADRMLSETDKSAIGREMADRRK